MDTIIRDIPEQLAVSTDLLYLIIRPETKKADVIIMDNDARRERIRVDLPTVVAGTTPTQQATIKMFLRQIVAAGLGMDVADVPDVV